MFDFMDFLLIFTPSIDIDMENETSSGKNGILITALALLIVPLFIRISWMVVGYRGNFATSEEQSDHYLHFFPSFLQNLTAISLISFLLCLAALVLGALSIDRVKNNIRWLAFACVLLSFLTGLSCLKQIM
jgi:ABC-type spermidine/putrescine transport system permease subunit I